MLRRLSRFATSFLLLAGSSLPAFAHTGIGTVHGFSHGFLHPIGGLDHVLAMVAVGLLAAQIGGRALYLLPATFMAAMAAGGLFGIAGVPLPFVEIGIVGSVIVLGGVITFGRALPLAGAMALAAVFAVFHGHAHGTQMPADASGLAYGLGLLAATALLHAAGIAAGTVAERAGPAALRIAGAAIAVAGLGLIVG